MPRTRAALAKSFTSSTIDERSVAMARLLMSRRSESAFALCDTLRLW